MKIHISDYFTCCYFDLQVTVVLKDTNDHTPVFVTPDRISVPEGTTIGKSVFRVNATDKDTGQSHLKIFVLIEFTIFFVQNKFT